MDQRQRKKRKNNETDTTAYFTEAEKGIYRGGITPPKKVGGC